MRKNTFLSLVLAIILALSGCTSDKTDTPSEFSSSLPARSAGLPAASAVASLAPSPPCFFENLADESIAEMQLSGQENDFEKTAAAFVYVIEHTSYIEFDQPALTDSWRYLDACRQPPTVYETLATSPLLFGIGSCENYAGALMLLLERMGMDTRYVTGSTFSKDGQLVDHAWVLVQIEENWYHIDPQLEHNIVTDSILAFKYFLKGDKEFSAHHVWGSRLSHPDAISAALPACPASAAAHPPRHITHKTTHDMDDALEKAKHIKQGAVRPAAQKPAESLPLFPSQANAEASVA